MCFYEARMPKMASSAPETARGKEGFPFGFPREHSSAHTICGVFFVFFFMFLFFSGPHSQHMEVPRLGVASELQLLDYSTATAT